MTPIGRVTMKARPKAKSIPHQGSCTSFFQMKDINKERAMLPISRMRNHHSGTCLYFFISFACISIFAEPIADLLCFHISLSKLRRRKKEEVVQYTNHINQRSRYGPKPKNQDVSGTGHVIKNSICSLTFHERERHESGLL